MEVTSPSRENLPNRKSPQPNEKSNSSNGKSAQIDKPCPFLFGNIEGLMTRAGRVAKIPMLEEESKQENYLFMALTETFFDETAKESEYRIEGYSHILCNRINRPRGGVIIYLRNDLTYKVVANMSDNMCSLLAITINELSLTTILVYRPPIRHDPKNRYDGPQLEQSFNDIVINNIKSIIQNLGSPVPNILLMGDFNFPRANWNEGVASPVSDNSSESRMLNRLLDVCETHNLLQRISFGTRPTPTGGNNILDLVFTNNHELISDIRRQKTAMSDHALIECDVHPHYLNHRSPYKPLNMQSSNDDLSIFNMHRADWDNIRNLMQANGDFGVKFGESNEENMFNLKSVTFSALEQFCPKYKNKKGQSNKIIPRDRRILFRPKKRKKKRLKDMDGNSIRAQRVNAEIEQIEEKIMDSLKVEQSLEEEKAIRNIKANPKFFYSYARQKKKAKGGIGPLKKDGKIITAPEEICECLSAQYSSAYSTQDPTNTISDPQTFFNLDSCSLPTLQDIEFTEDMIEKEIDSLKINSAAGPDHFPTLLLKKCKKELKKPLYILWRSSLDKTDIAQIFRHAITCPILKGNSETYQAKSYRPVSLTSHLIKIFEKIMAKAIMKHLMKNNLVPWNQHAFIEGRSTTSQLINHTELILRYLENNFDADTIYLDFAKAFDKVDHYILCKKLKEKRIGGLIGAWIHNFLTSRTMQVSANGALSAVAPVLSGVPQGTVLGPVLFMIMISDIDNGLNQTFMSLFADDSRLTGVTNNEKDGQHIQHNLSNVIYPWAEKNNAAFNGEKFEHIHFGKKVKNPRQYLDPSNNAIKKKDQIKDLGITISDNLIWKEQIDKVVANCRRQSAWILRLFTKRDATTMKTLWVSKLRPLVDYCSPVWSPHPKNFGQIDHLESVLRSFSKNVEGLQDMRYSERLSELGLHSVQRRHERYKIIYLYKIKENFVPNLPVDPLNPRLNYALKFRHSQRHGVRCDLVSPVLHHNSAKIARDASFAQTASNLWNTLPKCITTITGQSVDRFKKRLDLYLDLFPDKPRCDATGFYVDDVGRKSNSILHMRSSRDIARNISKFNAHFMQPNIGLPREDLGEVIPHPL